MIGDIKKCVVNGDYRFTLHGFERCIERNIAPNEIKYAIISGEIIEDYPDDKYGHSILIYGETEEGRAIHVHCSIDPVWIITAYDPRLSPDGWEDDFKKEDFKKMKCAACHHEMVSKRGEIDLRVSGVLFLVRDVAYDECPSCGEKVISPDITNILYEKVKNEEFVKKTINVPVLDGTYG